MTSLTAPTDLKDNLVFRASLLDRAEKDPVLQELIVQHCANDIVFFFQACCWTYDPREELQTIPYILWPKQLQLINKLEECLWISKKGRKVNLVLDKPRGVGATYTVMTWLLHHVLFEDFSARIGSRVEDLVDKDGDRDTLFAKLDFTLERLPDWFLTRLGIRKRSKLVFQTRQGEIIGESSNPNFARGGRKTVVLFDEHGFWENQRAAWESAGESTNFRISMSTPNEEGEHGWYNGLLSGKEGRVEKFNFDWNDVPGRDEAWYAEARATKSEENFARDVLKSYAGTTDGKPYAVDFKHVEMRPDVEYDPNLPLFIAWDFGLDTVAMLWIQKNFKTNKLIMIDEYHAMNKHIDFFVPFVTGVIKSGPYEYNDYEQEVINRHRNWTKEITHFGDPNVDNENVAVDTTTHKELQKAGIYVQAKPWAGRSWFKDMREKTAMSFRRLVVHSIRCEYFVSSMRSCAYPKRRENSQAQNEAKKPVHNWTSHSRTAYEYFIDNEPKLDRFDPDRKQERERKKSQRPFNRFRPI